MFYLRFIGYFSMIIFKESLLKWDSAQPRLSIGSSHGARGGGESPAKPAGAGWGPNWQQFSANNKQSGSSRRISPDLWLTTGRVCLHTCWWALVYSTKIIRASPWLRIKEASMRVFPLQPVFICDPQTEGTEEMGGGAAKTRASDAILQVLLRFSFPVLHLRGYCQLTRWKCFLNLFFCDSEQPRWLWYAQSGILLLKGVPPSSPPHTFLLCAPDRGILLRCHQISATVLAVLQRLPMLLGETTRSPPWLWPSLSDLGLSGLSNLTSFPLAHSASISLPPGRSLNTWECPLLRAFAFEVPSAPSTLYPHIRSVSPSWKDIPGLLYLKLSP